jgi:hypothetical protein
MFLSFAKARTAELYRWVTHIGVNSAECYKGESGFPLGVRKFFRLRIDKLVGKERPLPVQ